jgi:hypothetical protein
MIVITTAYLPTFDSIKYTFIGLCSISNVSLIHAEFLQLI